MHIAEFAVKRRVTILMMVLAVVLIGTVSYARIPVDLLPNMSFPVAAIMTDYQGAAPEEVESMVTIPLESVLGTLTNIREVQSISSAGRSIIILQFDWNTDMDMAALDIREKTDMVKQFLPSDVGDPMVIKFDPSMLPTMQIGLSADEIDLLDMRHLAEDTIAQRLERLPGVASVTVSGGVEQEYHVDLNQEKMAQYGITVTQVSSALRAASVNLPGGKLQDGDEEYLIRTFGKIKTAADLKNLVVGADTKIEMLPPVMDDIPADKLPDGVEWPPQDGQPPQELPDPSDQSQGQTGGDAEDGQTPPQGEKPATGETGLLGGNSRAGAGMAALPSSGLPSGMVGSGLPAGMGGAQPKVTVTPIYLRDIAKVELATKGDDSVARLNGQPNVSLSVQKQSDANTVVVANAVHAELDRLREEYPDINLTPVMDQSEFINIAIRNVKNTALLGAALAILILLFFLRSLRSTLVIAVSVPVSIIATFIFMFFSGVTVNLMTLAGLALGVGMLVDNSIVVLENIFRHLEMGDSREVAAEQGAREVSMAITASTLTTVAVFLPVVYVGGVTGIMFKELALTVSFSLVASLLVALTVVPMLSANILAAGQGNRAVSSVAVGYGNALRWSLRHKWVPVGLIVLLLIGSVFMYQSLGGEFIPSMDTHEFTVTINMPSTRTVDELYDLVDEVEAKILADPDVELLATSVNSSVLGLSLGSGQSAILMASLRSEPERSTSAIVAEMRSLYEDHPQADISISGDMVGGSGGGGGLSWLGGSDTVQVDISGPDLEQLADLSDKLVSEMQALGYYDEITSSFSKSQPELQVQVDFEKASSLGMPPALIGSAVRSAFQGETVTNIVHEGRDVSVVVRLRPEDRQNVDDLQNYVLASQDGKTVRLGDVAKVVKADGPRQVRRIGNQRLVSVTAEVVGTDLRTAEAELQTVIEELGLPDAYQAELGGQLKEMREAFSSLWLALLLAIALVYMVMAAQFESLLHPLIVMFTLPLAAIGVFYFLFFTGQKLNVPSIIGIILLTGIVVNNAIVLVDYINQLRRRGRAAEDALVEAGVTRLRPILMTALTTLLGLLPMAVRTGAGAELLKPLAIAVIGGLTTATFLTLFIIPIVYSWFERLLPWSRGDKETSGAVAD